MKDHISICICTFRRKQMLENLLKNLVLQNTAGLFEFSVVVVDNDATGSAKETVMRLKKELSLGITYDIELEQTISVARNHALRLAVGNYIGIIDDDEYPHPQWLLNMHRAIKTYDVDGALGPIHPIFDGQPPRWLIKAKFCERPVHPTGTLLNWNQTRTGNCLIKKEVFDKNDLLFDETFKTGGSDQDFFKRAMEAGCRFVAVEEAPVYEIVPPERWTKSYYLKRALVNGYNSHRYNINSPDSLSRLKSLIISASAVLAYILAMPLLAFIGTHMIMKYAEKGAHHLSRLAAMMGIELVKKRNF